MDEWVVSIGTAVARSGVPAWKLRAWESQGLLVPRRSAAGYRLYSSTEIERAGELLAMEAGGQRLRLQPSAGTEEPSAHADRKHVPRIETPTVPTPSERPRFVSAGRGQQPTALERSLQHLALAISHSDDSALALQAALDCALEIAGVAIGALSYADMVQQRYVLAASRGLSEDYKRGIGTWSLHEGLAGKSYGMRESLAIADLRSNPDVPREIVRKEGLRGYACIPLLRGQRRLGILEVFSPETKHFASDLLRPLEIVGATASTVLETVLLKRDLQKLREERYRVIHDWTAQAAESTNAERADTIEALRAEASAIRGSATAPEDIAAKLEDLARRTAAAGSPGVDVLPAVLHQMVPRLSDGTAKNIEVVVDDWPARLPLELTTRLYQAIHALLAPAATAAFSAVRVVFSQRGSDLVIEIHDDREALPTLDRLSMVTADARLAVRGLGGFVERTTDPDWTCSVRAVLPFSTSDNRLRTLTAREFEILGALALGQPNRELATALEISTKTLQNHLTAIYRKLGVSNRTQAMRLAVSHNPTTFWEGSHEPHPA